MPFLFQLQFNAFSIAGLAISLALGLLFAWLLYPKLKAKDSPYKKYLFGLRTALIALICFLLFAPLIKLSKKVVEKPLIIFLTDNSQSIKISGGAGFNSDSFKKNLEKVAGDFAEGYEIKRYSLGNSLREDPALSFNENSTDLATAIKTIYQQNAGRNIGAVVLSSDGLYNRGGNPLYAAQKIKAPVYCIALGDTIPKKDILISNVNYNNRVYAGNDFQIEVLIEAYHSSNERSMLNVVNNGKTVVSKIIGFDKEQQSIRIPLIIPSAKKGFQQYKISLSPLKAELSKENNTYSFYVEVLDGKVNVFLLADSPHPDLSAIRQSLENNKNYEVKIGFADKINLTELKKSDLVILHQLPSNRFPINQLQPILSAKNRCYIIGGKTNLSSFNSAQNILKIDATNDTEDAIAIFNEKFSPFVLSESSRKMMAQFPPLAVPAGLYHVSGQAWVLLKQQIGALNTGFPMWLVAELGNTRMAIITGEGFWRWRLEDFKTSQQHNASEELINQTIQFLNNKERKKDFEAFPAKQVLEEDENLRFNAELYNEAGQITNLPDVSLKIKSNTGKLYNFIFSKNNNRYELDAGKLPVGEYQYEALTALGNRKYQCKGNFSINKTLVELRQTTANHQLLYTIARQSGGELIFPKQLSQLSHKIKANELVKTISHEDKRYEDLINQRWIFGLILLLISTEWFFRKRNGEL